MRFNILTCSLVLLLICCFAQSGETKKVPAHVQKKVKTQPVAVKMKPVTVYVLDKTSKELISEKGLIDGKGVVSSKCKLVRKYFEEVENTLIVKTDDGKVFQLGKILSCNIKKDITLFLLEPLRIGKGFPSDIVKPSKTQPLDSENNMLKPAEMLEAYNAEDWVKIGVGYQESKNFDKAAEAFKEAIKMKPNYLEAYINLGNIHFILGKYSEAIEAYNYAVGNIQNKNGVYNKIGTSYFILGDYNKAIETYKQAINNGLPAPETHFSLALTYFLSGNSEEAFNEYINLSKINSQLAENLFDLLYR